MARKYHILTYADRVNIEKMLKEDIPVVKIAEEIGMTRHVAYLPVQYQHYEEKKSLMEKVKSCIQQSITGIKYSERTLENKFVHKLLKKALGVPESM